MFLVTLIELVGTHGKHLKDSDLKIMMMFPVKHIGSITEHLSFIIEPWDFDVSFYNVSNCLQFFLTLFSTFISHIYTIFCSIRTIG